MHEMVMQTSEPFSTREATERLLRTIESVYEKAYLEHTPSNTTHLNTEEKTQLLRLLKDFKDLFDGTLGDRDIDPADLYLKPNSKPFNCKYYLVPIIHKYIFRKYLEHLVKIGMLTLVQQSQYGTPVFIILKK